MTMEAPDHRPASTDSDAKTLSEKPPAEEKSPEEVSETLPVQGADLEKGPSQGEETPTQDPTPTTSPLYPETDLTQGIVGWDGQDDPANPQNFSMTKKWSLLALVSAMTFVSPLASSMFSPALTSVAAEFEVDNETLLAFSVSIFLLGYTFGPLFLAPLSEIYGRRIIFSCASWFFVVWQIGCALAPNLDALIVFRFLSGIGGSGSLTLGAGVIADLFPPQQRGMAASIWSMGPLVGPVVGPIAGGFIGESIGWRWVFWILLIAGAVLAGAIELLNQETYAVVLIRWKTARLARELNRDDLRSAYEPSSSPAAAPVSTAHTLAVGLQRPILLFIKSPIVAFLSTYMALVYGLLYLFFTTIPTVFRNTYGFSPGLSGLAYLGIGLGFGCGLAIMGLTSDKILLKLAARNGGKLEPEMRLPTLVFYACILPISFFWYGWSADKHVHWIVPIIGMFPFGVGMMGVFMPVQTYTIDCYPRYAASANAALTATRSLVGALLPLAGPQMFRSLGLGWGNSLLGFLSLAFVPIALLLVKYGKAVRLKFPVDLDGKR